MQQQQYIGRYRVIGRLGKGGMGTVLRAVDDNIPREVAIKLPNETDPEDIARLRQECEVLMQMQHHHIVEIYGSGSTAGAPFYIVMEYVEGMTVEGLLRQQGGRLEPSRALKIALGVAEALAYAHRPPLRVIHRDIKPSNVLIRGSDGGVKVTDFGIAAVLAERSGKTAIGTLFYMAPEQAMGLGVDERSDLYSLGAMLYEMLTGQRAPQLASAPAQPPSLLLGSMLPPAMSQRIDALVLGLLRADRTQRVPQSATGVVEELRALLEGRPARPMSGPQAGSGEINYAPTQRSSQPMASENPYAVREWAARPPGVAAPAQSGPKGSGSQIGGAGFTPPGYQLVGIEPREQKRRISGKAVWALNLPFGSIGVSFVILYMMANYFRYQDLGSRMILFPFLALSCSATIFAVINSHRALADIRSSNGQVFGKGAAIAGLVLGYTGLLLFIGTLLDSLLLDANGYLQ
jgi:serine/threonine protein kinase